MAEIFREVDEEVRKEQYLKLWKRYGKFAVGAAVAVVLAVAGYQIWTAYELEQREEASGRYAAALQQIAQQEAAAAAQTMQQISDPAAGGYGLLSAFEEARLRAESGDLAGAVALWGRIAASPAATPAIRDVATLFAVQHQFESAEPQDLEAMLEPLLQPNGQFRPLALELAAVVALRRGDGATARERLQEVTDDLEAPAGARTRAAQVLSSIRD